MILDREVLIGALLANGTPQKASEALGVSRSTVYKAMAESGFNEAYMQAKQELLQAISNKLSNSMLQSIITVEQIRDNEENSPQVRLNSCQIILTTGYRIREQADIITRLEKLERAEQERRLDNNE